MKFKEFLLQEGLYDPGIFKAFFMAGGPGSGKSIIACNTFAGSGLKFINQNKSGLYMAIASHVTLGNAKNTLIQKMNQIQQIGHYIKTGTGYRVTAPEGYVAVDRVAGAVKIVVRLEFSRANFTLPKGWK